MLALWAQGLCPQTPEFQFEVRFASIFVRFLQSKPNGADSVLQWDQQGPNACIVGSGALPTDTRISV